MSEPIDPAAIMAAHQHHVPTPDADVAEYGPCDIPLNGYEHTVPRSRCEPYRLAEALRDAQATVQRVQAESVRRSDYDAVVTERNRAQARLRAALAGEGAADPEARS